MRRKNAQNKLKETIKPSLKMKDIKGLFLSEGNEDNY